MEMAVRPAHGCLDIAMDPGKGDAAGHLNAASDKGFDTQQGDRELVDRRPWRHADKYVVLLRHVAKATLVERLWTSACARVARTLDVYDCELSWWVLMSTGATGSRTCGPDTRSRSLRPSRPWQISMRGYSIRTPRASSTSVRVIGYSPTAVGGGRRDPRAPRG